MIATTAHILVIWAIATSGYKERNRYTWQPIGVFQNKESCENGAWMLNVDPKFFRCLPVDNRR